MTAEEYRGTIKSYTTDMVAECCCNCGIPFLVPRNYYDMLKNSGTTFYCPNGHGQSYRVGESEAQKLKRQLQQKENELAQTVTAKIQIENQLDKANKKLKKVASGQCPCCDKTYVHLSNHMAKKHPEFKK